MEFRAITQDQANLKFATMVLYAVASSEEETVKKAVSRGAPSVSGCCNAPCPEPQRCRRR